MSGWSYIGRLQEPYKQWPANAVVCVIVDDQSRKRETAKEVAKWLRDGMLIERVPTEWVRNHFGTTEPYRQEGVQ